MLLEFGGKLGLRQAAHTPEPHLVDLTVARANAPDILAVAGGPSGKADVAAIAAGNRNFARIRERIRERGDSNHHLFAHWHEINGTPEAPPAAGPVADLARRRAMLGKTCQDVDSSVQPSISQSVHRVGDDRHGECGVRQGRGAAGEALKASAMTEPLPIGRIGTCDAKPVIAFEAGMRITPLPAYHFTSAGDGQHALLRGWIELREPVCEVSSGADEARRRGQRVGRIVTWDHHAPPERQLGAVATSDGHSIGNRHIRLGLLEPGCVDDRLFDPAAKGGSSHRLDNKTGEAIAVIRIFEAGVWLDHRCRRKVDSELRYAGEWATVLPRGCIATVANDAGGVREKLRDRGLRDRGMEALDVLPDAVVESELTRFAELHDPGGSEALRMRGHAKPVTRRQRRAADDVGIAEGPFEDGPAFVDNRNHTTRLLGLAHLVFEPLRDVDESRLKPFIHVLHLSE